MLGASSFNLNMAGVRPDIDDDDEDLYSFNNKEEEYGYSQGFAQAEPGSALPGYRPTPSAFRPPTSSGGAMGGSMMPPKTGMTNNPWQANFNPLQNEDMPRPMTSVNAAGYSSDMEKRTGLLADALGGIRAPPLQKRSDNSPEDKALEFEREVHHLLEESALQCRKQDHTIALDKAKQAQRKEKNLTKFRDEKNIGDQNQDLTFATNVTLAHAYHANGMYTESLDTYTAIVKDKTYTNLPSRMRVNMGNIYFEQKKYPLAIKMYRMALDPMAPTTNLELRHKILRNIGVAFVKMGQYTDAAQSFEQIVENDANNTCVQTAFNLLLCYFALGDKKQMKKAFKKLLNVHIPGLEYEEDMDEDSYTKLNDELREHFKERQRKHWDCILKGAKLIAEVLEEDWEKGYDFVIEQLKTFALKREKCNLVGEMEMAKALNYLKTKKFQKAIEALKAFEKKEKELQTRASTNLAFIYILEGDLKNAQKYATLSVEADKYNSKALVNHGNTYFMKKEFENAKNFYIEALNAEPDCVEAMYNLGITCKELRQYTDAVIAFKKLYSMVPESIEVIYQIANTYAKMDDNHNAIEWYNRLIARVPTDPTILYGLGTLYAKESDENQAYNCYLESYRYYPVIMEAISWLGLYFVKNEIYEKALQYFERATVIQPKEPEWQLMAASCYRRIGAYQQAKRYYEEIHAKYPDNLECLKYLVQISSELGLKKEKKTYSKKMMKLEERLARLEKAKKNQENGEREEERAPSPSEDKDDSVQKFQSKPTVTPKQAEPPAEPQRKIVNDKKIEKDDDDILQLDGSDVLDQLYN